MYQDRDMFDKADQAVNGKLLFLYQRESGFISFSRLS